MTLSCVKGSSATSSFLTVPVGFLLLGALDFWSGNVQESTHRPTKTRQHIEHKFIYKQQLHGYHALRKFPSHMVKFVNGTMSSLFMFKNLLCYSLMLPNVAYYAIDFYPLFHLLKFIIQHKIHAFRVHSLVHRPFSTTVQQITKDVTLFLLSEKLILFHYSH